VPRFLRFEARLVLGHVGAYRCPGRGCLVDLGRGDAGGTRKMRLGFGVCASERVANESQIVSGVGESKERVVVEATQGGQNRQGEQGECDRYARTGRSVDVVGAPC
jgi:hypothetical protein